MRTFKLILVVCLIISIGLFLYAADHIDAPSVSGSSSDITDFYAFQGENTENLVFVANVKGLLSPTETANTQFDENVLIEFNIDTNADNIEDIAIQAIPKDGKMHFFGPLQVIAPGLSSTISEMSEAGSVDISAYGSPAVIGNGGNMTFFAGPRDDPFFMDFAQYGEIIGGNATGFNDPGSDTFAGTNVMSIVVEVPKSAIGGSGTINTWVETKIKS